MRRALLATVIVAVYLLHQDFWLWHDARPVVFGLLPPGLAYHVVYSIVAAPLMWVLVRFAWLDVERPEDPR